MIIVETKIQLSQNQNGGYCFVVILHTDSHLLQVFNFDEVSVLSSRGDLAASHTVT